MINKTKQIVIIALIPVLLICCLGCLEVAGHDRIYVHDTNPAEKLYLKPDNTFYVTGNNGFCGKYEFDEEKLYLITSFGTVTVTINNNGDVIDPDGELWRLQTQ